MDDLAYTHIQPTITSEKITATPTSTSWAQTYHAGHLFAVLSLTQNEEKIDDEKTLAAIGKEIINSFEEEYFTLETKSLGTIKEAIQTTLTKIPKEITACFLVCAIIANPRAVEAKRKEILYLFVFGNGQVALKRNDTISPLLQNTNELTGASGFLQDDDIIVQQTQSFTNLVPKNKLLTALSNNKIADAAETLAPLVHEAENGAACAIFISYRSNVSEKPLEKEKQTVSAPPPPPEEILLVHKPSLFQQLSERIEKIKQRQFALSHAKLAPKKILFLGVALLIAAILVGGIITTIQKQKHAETLALFQSIYPQAQKKYDEGQSLVGLNKNLAHDNFLASEKILKDGQRKFSQGSNEYEQISALLKKTEEALSNTGQIAAVDAKEVDAKNSPLLQALIKNANAKYAASDEKNIYLLTNDAIITSGKKTLIKNDNTWSDPAGVGVYLGSLYVLDKKINQLIKFPVTADGFGKQNYFTGTVPDLSKASALAIDGSVFILFKDGTLGKFTKGTADDFKITSVDKGLKNPSALFTTIDGDKLYILDNGNSRIVVLNKSGAYQAQYQTPMAKSAKAIDVNEKDKKLFLLSGGKVYEIELK